MKIFYSRVSGIDQSLERQLVNTADFNKVLEDRCSGTVPLFSRPRGSQLKKLIDQGLLKELHIHSIDRLGRNTLDILTVYKALTEQGIRIVCRNPSLENFDAEGRPNFVSEVILNILASLAQYENSLRRERQLEGIAICKAKNLYRGRALNTQETPEKFLSKKKSKQIQEYLALGYSQYEIKQILKCSYSTISKVKRLSEVVQNASLKA
jgi:DNA invertase Pin-like site-specific DNA recombinase